MRPPELSVNNKTLEILASLEYKVIGVGADTKDFELQDMTQVALDNFLRGVTNNETISLAHDIHAATANLLVPAMIQVIRIEGSRVSTCYDPQYVSPCRPGRLDSSPCNIVANLWTSPSCYRRRMSWRPPFQLV